MSKRKIEEMMKKVYIKEAGNSFSELFSLFTESKRGFREEKRQQSVFGDNEHEDNEVCDVDDLLPYEEDKRAEIPAMPKKEQSRCKETKKDY